MNVPIVHGWQNRRPEGHGQHWLAGRLRDDGHGVRFPQLPEPDDPALDDWLALLRSELAAPGRGGGERVLVCHSLAVLLWWQAAPSLGAPQPDRVLLVAPPSADVLRGFPEVAAFAPPGIETTPLPADRFRLDADVVPGGRHLDLPAGYGSWPSLLAWCTDPSVRITAR